MDPNPCITNPSLPTCVNYAFDAAIRSVHVARDTYNNDIQPAINDPACTAFTVATGQPCPRENLLPLLP
jgi:hypothetical protein